MRKIRTLGCHTGLLKFIVWKLIILNTCTGDMSVKKKQKGEK